MDLLNNMDYVPNLFIYDRTASLNEGDDPIDAILYPNYRQELSDEDETPRERQEITTKTNMCQTLISFVIKLKNELCESMVTSIKLCDVSFTLLHVGKYTLVLKSSADSFLRPDNMLRVIYKTFVAFYGGFQTAERNTTEELQGENVDTSTVNDWCTIERMFLGKSKSTYISSGATDNNQINIMRKFYRKMSILFESICSNYSVLGGLGLYKNKVIISHNLVGTFVEALTVIIQSDTEAFGHPMEFNVMDVQVYKCFVKESKILFEDSTSNASCYAVIHIKSGLSLTLIVQSDASTDTDFYAIWRRPCTRLKDELFRLYISDANDGNLDTTLNNPQPVKDLLHLKYIPHMSSMCLNEYKPVTQNSPRKDMFDSSVAALYDLLDVQPSATQVTLLHYSDYNLTATKTESDIVFSGFYNI